MACGTASRANQVGYISPTILLLITAPLPSGLGVVINDKSWLPRYDYMRTFLPWQGCQGKPSRISGSSPSAPRRRKLSCSACPVLPAGVSAPVSAAGGSDVGCGCPTGSEGGTEECRSSFSLTYVHTP